MITNFIIFFGFLFFFIVYAGLLLVDKNIVYNVYRLVVYRYVYLQLLLSIVFFYLLNLLLYFNCYFSNGVSLHYYISFLQFLFVFYLFFFFKKICIKNSLVFFFLFFCMNILYVLNSFSCVLIWLETINYTLFTLILSKYISDYTQTGSTNIFYIVIFNFITTVFLFYFLLYILNSFGTDNLFIINTFNNNYVDFLFFVILLKVGVSPFYIVNVYSYKMLGNTNIIMYSLLALLYIIFFLNFVGGTAVNYSIFYIYLVFSFFFFKSIFGFFFTKYEVLVLSSVFFYIQYIYFVLL